LLRCNKNDDNMLRKGFSNNDDRDDCDENEDCFPTGPMSVAIPLDFI